jgi:energy-coupling factor transport system substrate-specific component
MFDFLMNLWFWPFITNAEVPYHDGPISYIPGDAVLATCTASPSSPC